MIRVLEDTRYALRMFSRRRGFAAVAVLAIAVGIATITAVFSIVQVVLLKSLPIEHIDRVVMLWQQDLSTGRDRISLSPAEFREYSVGQTSFDSIAAIRGVSLHTTLGDRPMPVDGIEVTPNIFETLGIRFVRGRGFRPVARSEAVITTEFWEQTLGGREDILGQVLTLRGGFTAGAHAESLDGDYVIVGILPGNLKLPYRAAGIWLPLDRASQGAPSSGGLLTFARLKPGITLARASSEVAATAQHLQQLSPTRSKKLTTWLVPLRTEDSGDITPSLILLAAAAILLSLIVCADVANMLLSTLLEREREMETRRALGATRGALLRQLLTEGTMLALAGTGVGVLLAIWLVSAVATAGPATIPRLNEARVDAWALGVAVATAFAMAVSFSIAPALRSARGQGLMLRQGNTARGGRLREVLIVAEFALASVVLSGAGLVLASAHAMERAAIGYDPSRTLTFRVSLPRSRYAQPQTREQFFTRVLERLRATPGVTAAGAVSSLPQMGITPTVELEVDATGVARLERPRVQFRIATPGYFSSLGIRVLRGRELRDADLAAGAVVISRSLADRFWPNSNPVGRRLRLMLPDTQPPWVEIAGVVEDVMHWISYPGEPTVYWANLQQPAYAFAVRTEVDPTTLSGVVTQIVSEIDREQPVFDLRTMQDRLIGSQEITYGRFRGALIAALAGAALLLAAMGLYGVVRYAVAQRTQEFGIRIALGASPGRITALVVRQSLRSVVIGGLIGVLGSLGVTRLLRAVLYEAAAAEPLVLAAGTIFLGMLALAASIPPAWRAGYTDPMQSLRSQ